MAMYSNLFDRHNGMDGFAPYLVGDSRYPLLLWLMVLHRKPTQLSLAEQLFNTRLRKGRCDIDNAFGILKQTFKELLVKSQLHITFMPDVIICCAILLKVLLGQSHEEVEELLDVLRREGLDGEVMDEDLGPAKGTNVDGNDIINVPGIEVRGGLGLYLSMQRL